MVQIYAKSCESTLFQSRKRERNKEIILYFRPPFDFRSSKRGHCHIGIANIRYCLRTQPFFLSHGEKIFSLQEKNIHIQFYHLQCTIICRKAIRTLQMVRKASISQPEIGSFGQHISLFLADGQECHRLKDENHNRNCY